MALADVAKARIVKGPPCEVCSLLARLREGAPEQADLLVALLSNGAVRYSEIAEEVNGVNGKPGDPAVAPFVTAWISQRTFARHARGECLARTRLR